MRGHHRPANVGDLFGPQRNGALHAALTREVEALMHDAAYDRNAASLPSFAFRAAQCSEEWPAGRTASRC